MGLMIDKKKVHKGGDMNLWTVIILTSRTVINSSLNNLNTDYLLV